MADHPAAEIAAIRQSGLLLSAWYLPQHAAASGDGVEHFCQTGWREGARPNPYFDPAWYLARNPEVAAADVNPLLHYLALGEAENRNPCPWFDVAWYRETYHLAPGEPCLAHFLKRRLTGQVSPVPVFDAAYYLQNNPDVAAGQADPFEHFLVFGVRELRDPAPEFDMQFYLNRYGALLGGENPLLHYLANRADGNFMPRRPEHEGLAPSAVRKATRPSLAFESFQPVAAEAPRLAMLLAFYLPQFHAVPENDAWWGKGFTDWTNLGRAMPRFVGHLQPRVPRDLGYYSLDDPQTLRRQIALAKGAGLGGFVFYTYWFNRTRLLDKPLEQLMSDPTLDFPFCVMWANENWTRRWDGLERDVLIAQEYLERDDPALIACYARYFADPRYIRIAGRPLFMIYRAGLIPDAETRIAKWRRMFRELHGEDPLIIMAQSLGEYDPTPYGLDGAIEFPPHKLSQETRRINDRLDRLDPDFAATVHDYEDIAETSLRLAPPAFPLIKTIVPGWDNDPRREGAGLVLHNTSPARYQAWLEKLVEYANKHLFYGMPIIGVNAWNEWAEGAFLEPDLHFGAAFLNATSRALCLRDAAGLDAGILLVGHDAQPHGAQLLLLHLARHLRRHWGFKVHLLLLGVGPLLGRYYETAEVSVAYDKTIIGNLLDQYRAMGITHAIVNSAASARVVPWAQARGIRATLLVHEMPQLLREYNLEIEARLGAAAAAATVFSAQSVADKFYGTVNLPGQTPVILPQGNYHKIGYDPQARARVRRALGVDDRDYLVLGAGFAHIRKGFDLFLALARKVAKLRADAVFVWVGDIQAVLHTYLAPEMALATAAGCFKHVPFTEQVAEYFAAADVFALTSREDPYPTVVMEALACGTPCVAFEDAGGIPELLRREKAGRVARLGDVDDFLAELSSLLDHERLEKLRPRLAQMSRTAFDFGAYVEKLLKLAVPALRTVSAAVISYNHAAYLPQRLAGVFAQTYPIAELLVLDDASTDGSAESAAQAARDAGREITLLVNERNGGSPFLQWRRAAEAATSEFIWLAEADDDAAPTFLARLLEAMAASPHAILGFCDSRAVDEDGRQTMPDYQSYYFDAGVTALSASGIWPAQQFARLALWKRNLIPNVSAVLWRREALLAAFARCPDIADWKLAGDWRLYLAALTEGEGDVVYIAATLNTHRRHSAGVTATLGQAAHLREIAAMQAIAAEALALDKPACAAQAEDLARMEAKMPAPKAKEAAKPARKRPVASRGKV